MALMTGLKLTLGPVLFNWPTGEWLDFYYRIADEAPVDRVSVGEVVCSKRTPFRDDAVGSAIERLSRGGKEVALATLALPTLPREIAAIRDIVESGWLIEANDMTTVHLLAGRPHITGPFLNVYSEESLALHIALGARSVCLPPELTLEAIGMITAGQSSAEVFAFGRAPLAISARCYHARANNLPKDACQFVCDRDRDGMDARTMDGRPFLTVNGVQTLGHTVVAAARQVPSLRDAGIGSLRLSPHSCDMVAVLRAFRALADGRIDPEEAIAALSELDLPGPLSDGYLRGIAGARRLEEVD
jgi:collagenase-like PrtC family protease